ncbi:hypothetical protein I4U23_005920 [Adineta vaga]|nr:hypothetical protein I4U23_005920 [Adineta vaga]
MVLQLRHYVFLIIILFSNSFLLHIILHEQSTQAIPIVSSSKLRVVLGIQADWQHMITLVNASQHTWIPLLPYDIFYFVGISSHNLTQTFPNNNIISLPVIDNDYPPVNKTFAIWSYFFQNHLLDYHYFILIDADTYVNVNLLTLMIQHMTCRHCYVGIPGIGESKEREYLDLHGPYCLGMGYVIAQETLRKFGPHINECRILTVAQHSDTVLGRCIYQYADGLSCTPAIVPFRRVLSTVSNSMKLIRYKYNKRRQLQIEFPESPPTKYFRAAMVHPLKKPQYFYQFHRQVTLRLRPILPIILTNNSCVANPIIQQEIYPQKRYISECPSLPIIQSFNLTSLPTFVITLKEYDHHLSKLINAFHQHGLSVQRFDAQTTPNRSLSERLSHGAMGLRLAMTRFFEMALKTQFYRVFILESDAIPHRQFASRLHHLLNESRCGGHLQDYQTGGILMLGATVWKQGWKILDKFSAKENGSCRNIGTKTYGSFAGVFHRNTFEPILHWLNTNKNDPYDFIFTYLARLGYPIRLAIPNLVITDVKHKSLVGKRKKSNYFSNPKTRAQIHRWYLKDYMFESYI